MAGHVRFLSGFNTVQTPDETKLSGLQRVTKLTLSATPGSGLGRYPGCESPDIVIREINGQRPDEHGRFLLSATGCYWVRQPQNTVPGARNLLALEPTTLQIGNDCGPCCVRDDYVRVYKGLRRVWQTYKEIGQRAVTTRDQLAATVADDSHGDNLHWEDLDYEPVPLQPVGQITVRVAHRGKLKPMVHALDDE